MPFTFAHPAILIPFKRSLDKYFNFSALVIGSMIPDFEYFIRFRPTALISHSTLGHLIFNIPVGLLIFLLYHKIVKFSLIKNLPSPFDYWYKNHGDSKTGLSAIKDLIVVINSILIGALSHVLWDSFTHQGGFFVTRLPFLQGNIVFRQYTIPIYKLLQHGGTLIGIFLILCYLFLIRNKEKASFEAENTKIKCTYWLLILSIALVLTYTRMIIGFEIFDVTQYGIIIVSLISGSLIGLLGVSLIYNLLINSSSFKQKISRLD